jgi:DNA-binding HxlR family transcriptional regulator
MYEKKTLPNLNCGLDLIGEVLYGKWKIRLLWFINEGHKRPSELQRKIPDASRRVLNMQLKELEEHELVTRTIYPVMPPKVEYSLTDFGQTLIPVISAIGNWGDEHEERLRSLILKTAGKSELTIVISWPKNQADTLLVRAFARSSVIFLQLLG